MYAPFLRRQQQEVHSVEFCLSQLLSVFEGCRNWDWKRNNAIRRHAVDPSASMLRWKQDGFLSHWRLHDQPCCLLLSMVLKLSEELRQSWNDQKVTYMYLTCIYADADTCWWALVDRLFSFPMAQCHLFLHVHCSLLWRQRRSRRGCSWMRSREWRRRSFKRKKSMSRSDHETSEILEVLLCQNSITVLLRVMFTINVSLTAITIRNGFTWFTSMSSFFPGGCHKMPMYRSTWCIGMQFAIHHQIL